MVDFLIFIYQYYQEAFFQASKYFYFNSRKEKISQKTPKNAKNLTKLAEAREDAAALREELRAATALGKRQQHALARKEGELKLKEAALTTTQQQLEDCKAKLDQAVKLATTAGNAFASLSSTVLLRAAVLRWRGWAAQQAQQARLAKVLHASGWLSDAANLRSVLISWHKVAHVELHWTWVVC